MLEEAEITKSVLRGLGLEESYLDEGEILRLMTVLEPQLTPTRCGNDHCELCMLHRETFRVGKGTRTTYLPWPSADEPVEITADKEYQARLICMAATRRCVGDEDGEGAGGTLEDDGLNNNESGIVEHQRSVSPPSASQNPAVIVPSSEYTNDEADCTDGLHNEA